MKVTLLSSLPPIKGISKYTVGLLDGLSQEQGIAIKIFGFKRIYPEFLYPGGTKDKSLKEVSLKHVEARQFLNWYNPLGWIYAGLTVKGDVLHAQWWSYVLAPMYITILSTAKFICRKKIVITVHNVKPHEKGALKSLANRSVLRLGDYFIVHSEANKKQLVNLHKISSKKISVVPHGILLPENHKDLSQTTARKKLDLLPDSRVILFFGIIREYKGLDILINAFKSVNKKVPKARLVIAGKPWEDWQKYQRIIDDNKLQTYVKTDLEFVPEDEVEAYFKASDVVVLPYKNFDSQSGAGSLALPFAKPIVVTNVGGLPELVKEKIAVCEPNNADQLAEALTKILNDRKLQKKLEEDSIKIAKNLSWEKIGRQTLSVYKKLIKS